RRAVPTMEPAPFDRIAWPPPTVDMSTTSTEAPPRAASSAALRPEMPAPTMTTSTGVWVSCGVGGAFPSARTLVTNATDRTRRRVSIGRSTVARQGRRSSWEILDHLSPWHHLVKRPVSAYGLEVDGCYDATGRVCNDQAVDSVLFVRCSILSAMRCASRAMP